jgi:hypothetical protein
MSPPCFSNAGKCLERRISPQTHCYNAQKREKALVTKGEIMSYLIARILLTLVTLGYGFATVLADFNETHATNPRWTGHARFHVVWQISSYAGFGLLALALTWWPGPYATERLYLVALMAGIVYAAFFIAAVTMPVYGGAAYDDNGYLPFRAPVPVIAKMWDVNMTVFGVQVVLLALGVVTLAAS